MKAVALGAIISLMGLILMLYGWSNMLSDFIWFGIGFFITMIGVWILGVKFRQWVYRH